MQKSHKSVNRPACLFYPRVAILSLIVMVGSLMSQPAMAALCSGVFPKDSTEQSVAKLDLEIMDRKPGKDYKPFPTAGITLAPGDYFYVGDKLKTKAAIKLSTPGQQVRIFIEGDTEFAAHSEINMGGNAADLLIVVRGDLSIGTKNRINALIYVTGDTDLNPDVHVSGALTAEGSVSTKVKDAIDYDKVAAEKFSSGELCTPDGAAVVDHFELSFSTPQFSCEPIPVSIRACADTACSSTVAINHTIYMKYADRWLGGGEVIFEGADRATAYLKRKTEPPLLEVGVAGESYQCRNSTGSCELTILGSGFQLSVPNLIAGKGEEVTLQAMRLDKDGAADGACVVDDRFVGTPRQLMFWSVSPDSGTHQVIVNGNSIGTAESSATPISVVFDKKASTSLAMRYDDAGKLELKVKFVGTGEEEGWDMQGNTEFVSRPYGLCLETDLVPEDELYRAGEDFELRIQAKAWTESTKGLPLVKKAEDICGNPTLKNYDQIVRLTSPVLLGGKNSGWPDEEIGKPGIALHVEKIDASKDAHVENVSIKEVGTFKIVATPPPYLGSDMSHAVSESKMLDRFIPAYFELEEPTVVSRCGSFTYAGLVGKAAQPGKKGEPFVVEGVFSARALGGHVTQNYEYAKLESGVLKYSDYGNSLNRVQTGNFYFEVEKDSKDGYFRYKDYPSLNLDMPEGPYSLKLIVAIRDGDGVEGSVVDKNINPDGTVSPFPEFRLGRARMINSHGSELENLFIHAVVDYFDGTRYVGNGLDNCSILAVSSSKVSLKGDLEGATEVLNIFPLEVQEGRARIELKQPGKAGSVSVSPQLKDDAEWLEFDWNEKESGLESPSGLATFGIYRGHERVIFRRELIGR